MRIVLAFVLFFLTTSIFGQSARDIVTSSGIQGGLVVHLGSGGGSFPTGLCANDSFVVHGLCDDRRGTAEARESIKQQGLYGRVSVQFWNKNYLPYADNLVNLVVVDSRYGIRDSRYGMRGARFCAFWPRAVWLLCGRRETRSGYPASRIPHWRRSYDVRKADPRRD